MELRASEYVLATVVGLGTGFFIHYLGNKRIEHQFNALEQTCLKSPDNTQQQIDQYIKFKNLSKNNDHLFMSKYYVPRMMEQENRPKDIANFSLLYWENESGNFVDD